MKKPHLRPEGIYDKEVALEKIKSLKGSDNVNSMTILLWWSYCRNEKEEGS